MKLSDLFKVSLVAAAVSLAGCGGDLVVKEGDANTTVNEGDTINNNYENGGDNGGDNGGGDSSRDDSQNATTGFPTDIDNALVQGLATDVSSSFPQITDKPVYKLAADTVFTADVSLTNDAHWILQGRTAVGNDRADNTVLYIQQGTTLIGETGDDFLVVRRGSQIESVGTVSQPITMTSIQDVTGAETGIGQWGGLVLLGNAPANSCGDQKGETTTEELAGCGVPAEGDAGLFGGEDEADNSGTIKYVVVKQAGKALGNGDELNGITFGGVGSATTVDYIQVHENLDDGIEFFGGTVNVSNVVLTSIGDDSLDWSFGWTGKATNVYIQQAANLGDNAIEADNSEFDSEASPLTNPSIENVTIVGAEGNNGIRLRAGTAGVLKNVFVTGPATYENCLRVGSDSVPRAEDGSLTITNSIVACQTPANNFGSETINGGTVQAWFEGQDDNQTLTPAQLMLDDNGYMPLAGSPLVAGTQIGAFNTSNNWMEGWTVAINGGFPSDIANAQEQGFATDVSSEFPQITDKPVYRLTEDTEFNADVTLTNDVHWILNGRTAVGGDRTNSATLYVQAGTTLIGESGDDFLVVRRGSQINANGTATAPITMTSIQDVTGAETNIGQWGGVVLLGNAPANSCGDQKGETTTAELEGCGVPAEGDAGLFGGTDPEDNSGVIRYVVVKHAGKTLGNGDELNGISFAGVGSNTKVEYIQVHQNLDDGIEFFGGTVNVRNVVLTDIGDDSFDWSFGWTGRAQNVYIQQSAAGGDNAFEADNSEFDSNATPLTKPLVSNVTVVGADGVNGVRLRAGTAGVLRNVVITGPDGYKNCLRVGSDSASNAESGELSIENSVVACSTDNNFGDEAIGSGNVQSWFEGQTGNQTLTSATLNLATDGFTPKSGSPLLGAGVDASDLDPFFTKTDYIGAFDGDNNWMDGWTVAVTPNFPQSVTNALEQGLATDVSASFPQLTDKPVYQLNQDVIFTSDVTLTNDAHWILKGRTAVGGDRVDSATLYVQFGTTLIGESGDDFLVVRRGSQIEAVGTASQPIVMTSIQDVTGGETDIGQWGGLVLLGNAPANSCGDQKGETTDTELLECGVPAEGDAGLFGGNEPEDNSGTLKYVVVKQAGKTLGNGDELNGITIAGVGSQTELDYIHVHENLDDGVEFFGGTASISHLVLTNIGDDSLDWSFGWTGNAQYVLIKQDSTNGDNAIEADNSEFDSDASPLTTPTISNVTIIGADGVNGVRLRAGTAGVIKNLVVTGPDGYSNCLRVGSDSVPRAEDGSLNISHSVVACAAASNFSDTAIADGNVESWFTAQDGNSVLEAAMLGLSDNGYMPTAESALLGAGFDSSSLNSFFDKVDYVGAMDAQNDWTAGWVKVGLK
ncbi:hypothetical protein C7Y70_04710 [Pseudoalteromonas sp. KS88]|uniref:hypothetical protein n=1 Tax=Pseudoalteromonas sp. KS88 TaxID=2109918 RepID=UPI0010821BA5|nr:hypothetical protein [Pseudoalteromonas sp. KS88]TGE84851.1 hypothetical protein C7Y70_04710 [Pseudoalteromonas sp. KS88]